MATPLAHLSETLHNDVNASLCANLPIRVRAIFRLARTALHLANGMLTVALVYPFITQGARRALKQRWSRQLLSVLGVRLNVTAGIPQIVGAGDTPHSKYPWSAANGTGNTHPSGLLVANHISFLDIFVINAWAPAAFVSKDDVRGWPLIGWLSQHTDTIFMQRGSRRAAQATRDQLVSQLRAGQLVAVFPEGTTSDGHSVQAFHSALFQSAIDATAPVMPLALRYFDAHSHQPSHAADYVGDMTLVSCMWSIASSGGLIAQLSPLPMIASAGVDRRHLAAHTHRTIAHLLAQMVNPSPKVLPAAGTAGETPDGLPIAQR
jgi:1-acyl-sn-glycerol-3-phosphate acyltransferase